MMAVVWLVALMACSGGTPVEAPPADPPAPDVKADAPPNPLEGKKPVSLKPLPDDVAVVLVGHADYVGATLLIDGEEKGKLPTKAIATPGTHKVELRTEAGEVITWEAIPFVRRHAGVTSLDLTQVPVSPSPAPAGEPDDG